MALKNLFSGITILLCTSLSSITAQPSRNNEISGSPSDSVQMSIEYLKKYVQQPNVFNSEDPDVVQIVDGLIRYTESENIDSLLIRLETFKKHGGRYVTQLPDSCIDSLKLIGYQAHTVILEKMKQLDREIWNGVDLNSIPLPAYLRDSLQFEPPTFNQDSAINAYRNYAVQIFSETRQKQLFDSLKIQNKQLIAHFSDSILNQVNDSVSRFVQVLEKNAINQPVSLWVNSLNGKPSKFWMYNNQKMSNHMFIKNEQNDSLGIKLMNLNRNSLMIAIDDHVTFNRVGERKTRDFVFEKFTPSDQKLTAMNNRYLYTSPWNYGGNGNFGFTQTYLNNWKAGGKSAFAFLMVLKGYANYNYEYISWENSAEIRNGWIRQGGDLDQTQKNDDKLELISRLGVSAFKKWYYSAEIDFLTQFFNGYDYPDKTKLISGFLSPAKTMIKLGLDYKPNKNFSLFLSPFTSKTVFVSDTSRIDQTKYGIPADSRSFWEPGLNADLRFKYDFNSQISYETKYKMFINYKSPFEKFDINWENTVVAQLTNRINLTFMLYLMYDDNVTFPTGKLGADGKEIYKAKWQTKELMTIGFSYKVNKKTYRKKN